MDIFQGKCAQCGQEHRCTAGNIIVKEHALQEIPRIIRKLNATKPFLLMDLNTREAAGEEVERILKDAEIPFSSYTYKIREKLEPDEKTAGSALFHYDNSCDLIMPIGTGVLNDTAKVLAAATRHPQIIVATAPSMDGFISPTSSMAVQGAKLSLSTVSPDAVIADIDILANAPKEQIYSGYGDMIAKYTSLCEWRYSNIINGEYYCDFIAEEVREAMRNIRKAAKGLLKQDKEATGAVMEGLLLSGVAMAHANNSRPASGMEHYVSHLMDMRYLAYRTPSSTHGIQCGVATLYVIRIYEKLMKLKSIDVKKAVEYAENFDYEEWKTVLRRFVGPGAEEKIEEEKENRIYDPELHKERIKIIAARWDDIVKCMKEELPSADELEEEMKEMGMPTTLEELGLKTEDIPTCLKCTKDIRFKYIGSRLLWDIGLIDEIIR